MQIDKHGSGISAGPVVLKEVLKRDLLLDNLYEFKIFNRNRLRSRRDLTKGY